MSSKDITIRKKKLKNKRNQSLSKQLKD